MTNYYKKEQFIATCDKNGNILGSIEKWEAHKKGILHKAFSVTLQYKDFYILQHRKHPLFDGVFDLSCSSHPTYKKGKLENDQDAVMATLKREWKIDKTNITGRIQNIGLLYYRVKDEKSRYIEHEMCEQFSVKIKRLPEIQSEYAYGYSIATLSEITNKRSRIWANLAPWSKKAAILL